MLYKKSIELLSTFFFVGRIPVMPGTTASLLGVAFYLILRENLLMYAGIFCLITALGFWSSGRMETILNDKDPSCVVIDEVSGVLIAFFCLPPVLPVMVTAFFVFRAFDMFKVYPVNKLEKAPGAVGVMMDDIIAGFYTNLTMQIAIRLAGLV